MQAAREQTIDFFGTQVIVEAAVRQPREPGEGYQRKDNFTFGPYQCYVYWSGGGQNIDRGNQADELTRQDRDATWGASFKLDDGDEMWPTGQIDAMSQYEFTYPGYGRLRIDRVQQMTINGQNVGWQVGVVRVS
jgi:hypothetical protein